MNGNPTLRWSIFQSRLGFLGVLVQKGFNVKEKKCVQPDIWNPRDK